MENSEQLIEKMKGMNIKPRPKWHFKLKTVLLWFVFLFSVVLGAFAFSVVLFSVQQLDFDLITHMSHSKLEFLMGMAPFFWIISLIVFLFVAMLGVKNSRKGYKFSYSKIIAFSTSLSILTGTLFFLGGGAQWLENAFSVRVGMYESIQSKKMKQWMMPEAGYLSGTIITINESSFQLTDFNEKNWTIDIEQANIPTVVIIEEGEQIKIMGEMISDSEFHANEIRRWGGNGQPMRKGKGKQK